MIFLLRRSGHSLLSVFSVSNGRNRNCLKCRGFIGKYMFVFTTFQADNYSAPSGVDNVSWVDSTPRSPVPTSLHLLALHLKPSLPGLRAPEHPLFTPSPLILIQVKWRGHKGYCRGVLITPPFVGPFCWSVGAQPTTHLRRANPLTPFLT